jgi:hypothetical protein
VLYIYIYIYIYDEISIPIVIVQYISYPTLHVSRNLNAVDRFEKKTYIIPPLHVQGLCVTTIC